MSDIEFPTLSTFVLDELFIASISKNALQRREAEQQLGRLLKQTGDFFEHEVADINVELSLLMLAGNGRLWKMEKAAGVTVEREQYKDFLGKELEPCGVYEEDSLDDRRFIVHPVTGNRRKHFSDVVRTHLDQMFSRGVASALSRCGDKAAPC